MVIKLMAVGMVVVAMVVVVVVALIRCGGCGEYQCSATPTVYGISISVRERASPISSCYTRGTSLPWLRSVKI